MNSDKIKEAAEKYADKKSFRVPYDGSTSFQDDKIYDCANDSFTDGALSDVAKEYWFAQFQYQQKQKLIGCIKDDIDTGKEVFIPESDIDTIGKCANCDAESAFI